MKMPDEYIILDIEKIAGYLEALEYINQEGQVYSDYFFVKLPDADTLIDSVNTHILSKYDKHPIKYWHISLEEIDIGKLETGIEEWFFRTEHTEKIKCPPFTDLIGGLLDLLQPYTKNGTIYKLNMIPPVWYGIHWDEFVLDSEHGRFLLSFSFSD